MAFAEQLRVDIPPEFRTAVVMSNQDAIALYKCLHKLLNESSVSMKLISVGRISEKDNLDGDDEPNVA